jgi:hypothetical protein
MRSNSILTLMLFVMLAILMGKNLRRAILNTDVTYVECNQGVYSEAEDAEEAGDTGCVTLEAKYGEYREIMRRR